MTPQTAKHRAAQTLPQSDWHIPGEVVNGNTAQDVVLSLSMHVRSGAPGHVGPGPGAQTPVPVVPVSFFLQTMPSVGSTQQSVVLTHTPFNDTPVHISMGNNMSDKCGKN